MSITRYNGAKILNTVNNLIVTLLLVVLTLLTLSTYTNHNLIGGFVLAGEDASYAMVLGATDTTARQLPINEISLQYVNEAESYQYSALIDTPKLVFVKQQDQQISHLTTATNIGEVLSEISFTVDEDDIVTPARDSQLSSNLNIEIIKVDNEFENIAIDLPFGSQCTLDNTLEVGKSKVVTPGTYGLRTEVYKITYNNGVKVDTQLVSNNIDRAPQDEVVAKGTKFSTTGKCATWDAVIDEMTTDEVERFWLKYVMRCESGCNDKSVSSSGAYRGLFQYDNKTFYDGGDGNDIFDGREQISQTLYRYRLGQQKKWPVCSAKAVRSTPDFCTVK